MTLRARGPLASFFQSLSDHVTGADIVRADRQSAAEAQQKAHIRVANLREKFQAVRELSESLNGDIDKFKRKRAG